MAAVNLSPIGNTQFVYDDGSPADGSLLWTYIAGSTTPLATYTDSTGLVAQSNPIILNSLGLPTIGQVFLIDGAGYDIVWEDKPIFPAIHGAVLKTFEDISGINDSVSTTSQWVSSGVSPTYISAISFSLPGDQTSEFHKRRRLQFTVSAGTVYGYIISSVFASLTTVTVVMEAGQVLDAGLSSVNLSILRADHVASPSFISFEESVNIASAATVDLTAVTGNTGDLTGVVPVTAWTMLTGQRMRVQFTAATPITYNATTNRIQGGSSIVGEVGSYLDIYYDGTTTFVDYVLGSGAAAAGPSYTTISTTITATGGSITNTAVGTPTKINSATATATNLMAVSTLSDGQSFTLTNIGAGAATFNRVGADTITGGNLIAATSIVINQGETVTLTRDSSTSLLVTASNVSFFGAKVVAVASTSGTSIDFSNVPTGTKRITLMLSGVSTTGTANLLVQIGDAGGIEATGYLGSAVFVGNTVSTVAQLFTTGFGILSGAAANVVHGTIVLSLLDSATSTWSSSGNFSLSNLAFAGDTSGSKSLSAGPLTSVRLTTTTGVDTFDAGLVNIIYE